MNKKVLTIWITAFVVLVVFISGYVKQITQIDVLIQDETKPNPIITYQITGGLAAYKEEMIIFSDGRIDYSLRAEASKNDNFRTANISKEELDRLIKLFFDNKFTSFNDSYGSIMPVSDAQKTVITFNFKGMDPNDPRLLYSESVISKQVTIEATAEILQELEEIKQGLAKKAEWFKPLLPKPEFSQGKGDCSIDISKAGNADIKLEAQDIIFQGRINTGNPCHDLSVKIETKEDIFNPETGILTIIIDSFPSGKICIQCAGSVEYSGKITNLSGMSKYKVIIKTDGTVIAEKEINIPITPFY